jgi:hypothetical protein
MFQTLTAAEQIALAKCAQAMYRNGENAVGHFLSASATKSELPLATYDRAMSTYRAWLCFDEVKR